MSSPAAPARKRHLVRLGISELVGTALLVGVGLSVVIVVEGRGSPLAHLVNSPFALRAITGGLFGAVGGSIALSPIGRTSGAHINPIVTLLFFAEGQVPASAAAVYVGAQCLGAILGAAPLLAFGARGASVHYGATVPGPVGSLVAAGGEAICSFFLIALVLMFVGSKRLRRFTPLIFAPLYAVMVALEAPWSGTSTNPARSLGPAVVVDLWSSFWVYLVGPILGAVVAIALRRRLLSAEQRAELDVAKLGRFTEDPFRPWKP